MLYLLVCFILMMFAQAKGPKPILGCDSNLYKEFKSWDSTCNTNPEINIDVLAVVSGSYQAPNFPGAFAASRQLCFEDTITAVIRVTPRADVSLAGASVLFGDAPNPEPVQPLFDCPASLDIAANDPAYSTSQCGFITKSTRYARPGSYPAAIFAETTDGKSVQVEGFVSIPRCAPVVNLDLGLLATKSRVSVTSGGGNADDSVSPIAANFREICAGVPVTALVRAKKAEGVVLPNNKVQLWTGVVNPANGELVTQDVEADGLLHAVDVTFSQGTGNYPVAMFANTTQGEEVQVEGLVYVQNC